MAIVALPLSMAISIACGLSPDRGLYTAIIGGFLISALGGSRYQIGGPAGAFIVLIAGVVQAHGYDGLVLSTIMAGFMMMAIGFLRLGGYIRYIPFPVTVGFTAGIAEIIFASQIKELLGLTLDKEPAALLPKLIALWKALPTINAPTLTIAGLSILMILAFRRWRPSWPGLLITVACAGLPAMASAWRSARSVRALAVSRAVCPCPRCRRSQGPVWWSCCRRLLPSRCWDQLNRCLAPLSPMA